MTDPGPIPDFLRRIETPEEAAAIKRHARQDRQRREGRNIKMPRRRRKGGTGLGMSLKALVRVKST